MKSETKATAKRINLSRRVVVTFAMRVVSVVSKNNRS
jgi:hypothetical protein